MATPKKPKRMKNVTITRPIIYGSLAFWLGKKADEHATHKWSCYVRGVEAEDLSYFIKKVVFQLHPSFPNPTRVVEKPPFEIHETGWGEFELNIRIYFHDPAERCVDCVHHLKLFPEGSSTQSTKAPVLAEYYDEIVFTDPYEPLYHKLREGPAEEPVHSPLQDCFGTFNEAQEIQRLKDAQELIKKEFDEMKQKQERVEGEVKVLRKRLATGNFKSSND